MKRFQQLKPTIEQKAYARKFTRKSIELVGCNKEESDREEGIFYGFLGETIVADIFEQQRPLPKNKKDEGFDLLYNGAKIDVKVRTGYAIPKEDYYVSFYAKQAKKSKADYLLYLLFNPEKEVFYVAGIMSVKGFLNFAKLYKKGDSIKGMNGQLLFKVKDESEEQYRVCIKDLAECELFPKEKVLRY
ncbi:hypothetical protein DRH27_04825 [Candidatus Falkowbacteria bacterium]|nr:MAG: hypothetical protein DRH27_04825 [Candidatus Falkowbacteria bacterium]